MERVLEKLKQKKNRDSTKAIYHNAWRNFNHFMLRLDKRPKFWEERVQLFCAYLVEKGTQSSMLKTYVSAIKSVLKDDNYKWDDNKVLLSSITRGCRVINDKIQYRLPLKLSLLEMILFEIGRLWDGVQPYLELMYRTLFGISYYGLMRVGEVTKSNHVLKGKDVHIGTNKEKILLVLHSSKTHSPSNLPQEIKITSNNLGDMGKSRNFCPFVLIRQYMKVRGNYKSAKEQFFIFADGLEVSAAQARRTLKTLLARLNTDPTHFNFHLLRIRRLCDLYRWGYSVERIMKIGRWKSSAIYRYLR